MVRQQAFLRDFVLGSAFFFVSFCDSAFSQELPEPKVTPNPVTGAATLTDIIFKKTSSEIWLSFLVVAFGLAVIGSYIFAIRKINHRRPEDIGRSLIVIAVITGSLLLITAGYSNQQVAPAFGLFGTIIGYMLGRMNTGSPSVNNGASEPKPERPNDSVPPQS